jgi:hypothetical protein
MGKSEFECRVHALFNFSAKAFASTKHHFTEGHSILKKKTCWLVIKYLRGWMGGIEISERETSSFLKPTHKVGYTDENTATQTFIFFLLEVDFISLLFFRFFSTFL